MGRPAETLSVCSVAGICQKNRVADEREFKCRDKKTWRE